MFRQALIECLGRLEQAKVGGFLREYALVGGFAVAAWGVPRATRDIDFSIAFSPFDPTSLAAHLGSSYHPADSDDPLRGVFRLTIPVAEQSIPIQLIILPDPWTQMIFKRLETLSIVDCEVPVVTWRTLVLLKLYAGRPIDLQDARDLLAIRQPGPHKKRILEENARALELSESLNSLLRSVK